MKNIPKERYKLIIDEIIDELNSITMEYKKRTAEATGDLVGNKIANEIRLLKKFTTK